MGNHLTPEQVAERLQVKRSTVIRWAREGKIASTKIGQTIRIPEEALAAMEKASIDSNQDKAS